MTLSLKQKKHIKRKAKIGKSPAHIAKQLNVPEAKVRQFLNLPTKTSSGSQPEITASRFKLKTWLKQYQWQILGLTLLVIAAYANALNNEFLSDDIPTILNSPDINSFSYVTRHLPAFLRPLLLYLTNLVFGKVPFFYRLINIFFHLGTVLTSFLLLSLWLNPIIALFSSALLAVHPMQIESVAWISGGPYVMGGFFTILSLLWFYFRHQDKKYYHWSLLAYGLALLSSERLVIYPLILMTMLISQRRLKKDWTQLIIPSIMAGAWALFYLVRIPTRISVLQHEHYQTAQPVNPLLQIPIAISSYLELIVWPQALTLYHSEMHFSKLQFAFKVVVTLSYFIALIITFFKKKRSFFWLSLYLIWLLPTLTPLGISWIVAERYAYLAAFGIYVCAGILIYHYLYTRAKIRPFLIGLTAMIILALTVRTIVRNHDWQNQDNLWLAAAKYSPSSPQNHNNLGDLYARQQDFKQAEYHFKKAVELNPRYADAAHNLANVYMQTGQLETAIEYYQKALALNPNLWQSYQNLAYIYFNQEKIEPARQALEKAIQINPNQANLYQNLSVIYQQLGQTDQAQKLMQQAIRLDPSLTAPKLKE